MGVSLRFFGTTENHPRPEQCTIGRGDWHRIRDKNRRHYCHQYKHNPFWSKNKWRKTQNYRKRRTKRQSNQLTFNRSYPLSGEKSGKAICISIFIPFNVSYWPCLIKAFPQLNIWLLLFYCDKIQINLLGKNVKLFSEKLIL